MWTSQMGSFICLRRKMQLCISRFIVCILYWYRINNYQTFVFCQSNRSFLDKLSVRKIPGIGRVCEALLKAFEIETVLQLRDQAAILPTLFSPVWCSARCLSVTKYYYLRDILIIKVFSFYTEFTGVFPPNSSWSGRNASRGARRKWTGRG